MSLPIEPAKIMDILEDVRVVEVAAWTFVPSAGATLADRGADVIKIDHPVTGDPQRDDVRAWNPKVIYARGHGYVRAAPRGVGVRDQAAELADESARERAPGVKRIGRRRTA